MIESVNKGGDGIIRSVNIRTTTGKTNCPITHLYPLEFTAEETSTHVQSDQNLGQPATNLPVHRPVRDAAKRGQCQMRQWIDLLCAPPGGCPEDLTYLV